MGAAGEAGVVVGSHSKGGVAGQDGEVETSTLGEV